MAIVVDFPSVSTNQKEGLEFTVTISEEETFIKVKVKKNKNSALFRWWKLKSLLLYPKSNFQFSLEYDEPR